MCCSLHRQHQHNVNLWGLIESKRDLKLSGRCRSIVFRSPIWRFPIYLEHAANRSARSDGQGWRIRGSSRGDPEHKKDCCTLSCNWPLEKLRWRPVGASLWPSVRNGISASESRRSFWICLLLIFTLATFSQFKFPIRHPNIDHMFGHMVAGYEEANKPLNEACVIRRV